MIKLSKLWSDGAVIQRNKKVHIFGTADAGSEIVAFFAGHIANGISDDFGNFDIWMDPMTEGGPYTLEIKSGDDVCTVNDIYIGEVFMMCGQSNMEFPMSRVKDTFPEEWNSEIDEKLRIFKIKENRRFDCPETDIVEGGWSKIDTSKLDDYPAIGYFFCKEWYRAKQIPVGVINASLGGSPIESWMSRDMLRFYPDKLELADKYANKKFTDQVLKKNESITKKWRKQLDSIDLGVKEKWNKTVDTTDWNTMELPNIFSGELSGFIGSVWLRKSFVVEPPMLNDEATVWLGTMVDSDVVYLNGREIGRTEYCYPPRRYKIPADLLKRGENVLTIRIRIEKGRGRVTPNKVVGVVFGQCKRAMNNGKETIQGQQGFIDLRGTWSYKIGAKMDRIEDTDFMSWKPTALFNGMLAPCVKFPIKAFLWYQGESNTDETVYEYLKLTRFQVEGLRKLYEDETLPYLYARLPEFELDYLENSKVDSIQNGWIIMQQVQTQIEKEIPYTYMIDTTGMGEKFDLHPQDKKSVAEAFVRGTFLLP